MDKTLKKLRENWDRIESEKNIKENIAVAAKGLASGLLSGAGKVSDATGDAAKAGAKLADKAGDAVGVLTKILSDANEATLGKLVSLFKTDPHKAKMKTLIALEKKKQKYIDSGKTAEAEAVQQAIKGIKESK
jgi:hypothetical protein